MSGLTTTAPLHPNPALYTSPEMIAELALGMDKPYDIAARYGLSKTEFDKLSAQTWFGEVVVRKRMELQSEGTVFEYQSKMMLQELTIQAFKTAITGGMPMNLVLDLMKQLGDFSGVKAKQVQAGERAQGFQINIQVNGDGKSHTRRLDVEEKREPVVVSIPMGEQLPKQPEGFRVPDFDLRVGRDLIGTTTAQAAASVHVPGQAAPTR